MSNQQDTLTLTLRLHDPKEKKDAKLSTSWAVVDVPRGMPFDEFVEKYIKPAAAKYLKEHYDALSLRHNQAASTAAQGSDLTLADPAGASAQGTPSA